MLCKKQTISRIFFPLLFVCLFLWGNVVKSAPNVTINATVPPICGNTVKEGNETCDDGNTQSGDGCSAQCLVENNNNAPPPVNNPPPQVQPPVEPPVQPPVEPPVDQPPADQPAEDVKPPAQNDNENKNEGENKPQPPAQNPAQNEAVVPVSVNGIFSGATGFVSSSEHISQSALQFWIGNGNFKVALQSGSLLTLFSDRPVLGISEYNLSSRSVQKISLFIKDTTFPLVWNASTGLYTTQFSLPGSGRFDAIISILYSDGVADSQRLSVVSLSGGRVKETGSNSPLENAKVTLVDISGGQSMWSGSSSQNPVQTFSGGVYGFVVPNGEYKIRVEKEGYHTTETNSFLISDHLVRQEISLVKKTPPLKESLTTNDSALNNLKKIGGKAKEYAELTGQAVKQALEKVNQLADNPQVEQVTEQVVAPVATTVAVATVVPSLWSIIVPFLRFLFLQPFLLFGKKRRKQWGTVYNSLNKLPIDLAVVRLIEKDTKKVKQSRVTDLKGRFLFMTEPGNYTLEVTKQGFVFPTVVLSGVKVDGKTVDIYHGEAIQVTDKAAVLTPNIPVDPVGENKTPDRIRREKIFRVVQHGVSLSGVILTMVGVYISPVWYMWVFLGVHILLYVGFLHFVRPQKPKGWGIVYEEGSKKPVGSAVIRLFTKEYNKLVSTQTTDAKGRYAFLVGPSQYYMTVEKAGYKPVQSETIEVSEGKKDAGVLKKNFEIKKN